MDVGYRILDIRLHHSGGSVGRLGVVALGECTSSRAQTNVRSNDEQAVIPAYSAYLAYTTFVAARGGMAGLAGAGGDGTASTGQGGASKRQAKLEKRGGQKVQYR